MSEEEQLQVQEAQYISFLVQELQYGKEHTLLIGKNVEDAIHSICFYVKRKLTSLGEEFADFGEEVQKKFR
ncbi:MAG: hypothetical protein MR598_05865 [Erysipelotrichaceae bacterium]|nr:hypothetical protein [Erysipelotrichaceae bacterium]